MKKKVGDYKIPFNNQGSQLSYPAADWQGGTVWKPNYQFFDTLTLHCASRGRSSTVFLMFREDHTVVNVFVSDFVDMCKKMVNGKVQGSFTFTKKGANYGCKLL